MRDGTASVRSKRCRSERCAIRNAASYYAALEPSASRCRFKSGIVGAAKAPPRPARAREVAVAVLRAEHRGRRRVAPASKDFHVADGGALWISLGRFGVFGCPPIGDPL